MSKIVLCIDHGNSFLKETENYLSSHDCKVYTLSGKNPDIGTLLTELEEKEGRIDLLLFGADEKIPHDGTIEEKHDCEALSELVGEELNSTQDAIEGALPLLRKGDFKRIGMITRKDSSVSYCKDDRDYGRHMALAGLNMMGRLYFNMLRPEGFTFRWYCAGENTGGMSAGEYLLSGLCYDAGEPYLHSDENRFVMRDSQLREIPW